MTPQILYKAGYKYQLNDFYSHETHIKPEVYVSDDYILLTSTGRLVIKKGYAWDGPSGPTLDTANFMRGSLVHDALYQLIRENRLDMSYRDEADKLLRDICIEDGMSKLRAELVYKMVRWFGAPAADPSVKHPMRVAP